MDAMPQPYLFEPEAFGVPLLEISSLTFVIVSVRPTDSLRRCPVAVNEPASSHFSIELRKDQGEEPPPRLSIWDSWATATCGTPSPRIEPVTG